MEKLPYKVIKSDTQYNRYCQKHEDLVNSKSKSKAMRDEIELLSLLIEKYDELHNTFSDIDPVQLLKALMQEHQLKAVAIARILNVSEGLVSDILKYKKGFSKESIRVLSEYFKVGQEAFNRPYSLKISDSRLVSKRQRTGKIAMTS
jgi:HTH-type transcriptional regulator/antitoxin HigA